MRRLGGPSPLTTSRRSSPDNKPDCTGTDQPCARPAPDIAGEPSWRGDRSPAADVNAVIDAHDRAIDSSRYLVLDTGHDQPVLTREQRGKWAYHRLVPERLNTLAQLITSPRPDQPRM